MDWIFLLRWTAFILLLLVCIFLLAYWKKLGKHSTYFILSMLFILVPNILSFGQDLFRLEVDTTVFFVIFVNILGFLFFFIYFYRIQGVANIKKFQLAFIILFLLVVVWMILKFREGFFAEFPMYFYVFETLLLIVFIALFFYDTFNSDIILNIKKYFPFWVSLSLIIIYVGLIPILFFIQEVNQEVNRNVYFFILYAINIIGYFILFYGILNSRFKKKNTLKYERY